MKNNLYLTLFFVFLLCGFQAKSQGIPELIYYKFDTPGSTVQNQASAPVDPTGTLNGATIGGSGQFGSALLGNGGTTASNSVNANWPLNLTGPWTMSMWFSGLTNSLSSNYLFGGSGGTTFRALTGSGNVAGAGNLMIRSTGMTDLTFTNIFDAAGTPVVIHLVYDPAVPAMKGYVNGVLTVTVPQPATLAFTGTNFTVGGQATSAGLPASGKMDEFRLYSRALAASEIALTWNQTLPYAISPNDAGVAAITSPSGIIAPGNQNIAVTLKNYGTAPLTSAQVNWKAGTTTGTPFSWTGNLASNATSTPIAIGNFNFPNGTTKLKAWTTNPNGAADGNTFNDTTTISITACSTVAGTFTINKNAAASATNFQSFTSAVNSLTGCGINGPVVFNVAAGSGPYKEQVVIPAINGTSATNTITFQGAGDTISAAAGTHLGVITLDGADFVKFDNFVITLDSAAVGWAVQLKNSADNNTISNCTISLPTDVTLSTVSGILAGTAVATAGNNTSNSKFINNSFIGGYYGIRINGNTGGLNATNNQISGNTFIDNYTYNIYLDETDGTKIENNTISRPNRATVSTFYGVYAVGVNKNTLISRNRFHNAFGGSPGSSGAAYVIYFSSTDAPVGSENIVKNNLIYNINTTGTIYAFYNIGSNGAYYYHNTIDLDLPANTGTIRGFYQTTAATNIRFINNIITINSGSTGAKHALYYGTTTSDITSNDNVLVVTGGASTSGIGSWGTANQVAITNWQSASSKDQNSITADPQYSNPTAGNFKPTNSSVNDIGQPLALVTDDFTGAGRSAITPDPGAYEFTPLASDAGVIAIISPVSPAAPNTSVPVTVTFKNYGSNALTSATLGFSVNGTAIVNNFIFTGTVAPNATANVVVGNYTFPAGSYQLCAWATAPADGNLSNDTSCVTTFACLPLAGNYTINSGAAASATNYQSIAGAANSLNTCGISGPVTFTVAANSGPYNQEVLLTAISGTSATNTVTFNGNGALISGSPTASLALVTLNGADYVTFSNFNLTVTSVGWGVQLTNAANNNIISNCTINLPLTSTSNNVNGIVAGANATLAGNNTSNSKFINNTINGGYYGIRINGNTGSLDAQNNQITGNTLKDSYTYNIYLSNTDGTLVENNTISRPTRTTVTTFYGIYMTGAKNSIISKNRIHNTHGGATTLTGGVYGIYTTASDAVAGAENIFRNNIIYNINNTGLVYAIYSTSSDGAHYYHNTIDVNNLANTGTVRGFYQTTVATNVRFINNIVTITGGATGAKHALYFGTVTSAITSNNNVLLVTSGATTSGIGSWGTANQIAISDWRTASSQDAASISVNPNYADPTNGNFKPTTVALNNIGQALASVTDDITGAVRNAAAPDPGAFEFDVVANDVGIIAIVDPNSVCGLSNAQSVTVTIKNFGSVTQTSVPVSFAVTGPVSSTGSDTFTGSIAPNGTANFTFTPTADLSLAGGYTLTAQTNLTGDALASNNSVTKTVTNSFFAGLPINLNFETPATGLSAMKVVTNSRSAISENAAAGNGSATGILLEGVANAAWQVPAGSINPWTTNPQHLAGAYMCFNPSGGSSTDSLWLTFDLKQLFKTANANTNFRVTVNGLQVGTTYRPPFGGATGNWEKVKIDLTSYKNLASVEIGLESSVMEGFANGTGTANLVDNITVVRLLVNGLKDDLLNRQLSVYPNPSAGIFNISLPKGKGYNVEVTDMSGKIIKTQTGINGENMLNLNRIPKGIYLLKVSSTNGIAIRKLIID